MKHTDYDQDIIASRYSRRPQRTVKSTADSDKNHADGQSTRISSVTSAENGEAQTTVGQKSENQTKHQTRDSGSYLRNRLPPSNTASIFVTLSRLQIE